MARNSRIITEKCSARIRSAHTYIRQCNMPSIERQYEAAYLSFLLLLSRAHFYERIHQPDYRWSLRIAFTIFSLFFSILAYDLLISLVFILSFFLRSKQGFPRCRKSSVEKCSIQVKVKELVTVPNIFMLDVVSAISDKRQLRASCSTM